MNKKPYIIKYSNHLHFNGRLLAFRKKCLFDLTNGTPIFIPVDYHNGRFWDINGKRLTPFNAEKIIKMDEVNIDVSELQWNRQIELDECFNLEKL